MTRSVRLTMFLIGAVGLAALWAMALLRVPGPPSQRDRYLKAVIAGTFAQRNVTDAVSAINFDYRAFDTLGEEFILFVSVIGSLVVLRQASKKEQEQIVDAITPSRDVAPSDAMRLWLLLMVAPKVVFGIYIIIHGQLTPGGGFQGGLILATSALIIYLGEGFGTFKKVVSHPVVETTEAIGAAAFVIIGMLAWIWGQPFLTNIVPLGKSHELTSGGMIPLISGAIGLEVAAGFVLLLYGFLQETLIVEKQS
jgi:multicomponent Na+:H+ antiporter subunit B